MTTKEYTIEGMSCQHCVMALKKELSKVAGIAGLEVAVGKASVQFDSDTVADAAISAAVEEAGFKVSGLG